MVAILNLLDLRSIMGMPRAQHSLSIYAHFLTKRENFNVYFWAKGDHLHSTTIFFFHYNLFLRKLEEKLAPKASINTDASISDIAHAPWASHNTPYNPIN